MKKPQHVILTLTPIDKKKAQVGMPPRDSLRALLDTLDRTPVMALSHRVWRPIGIVYEETEQYTPSDTGFYPPGGLPEMSITDYIQRRGERLSGPSSTSEATSTTPTEEPTTRNRRKIIIKSDKRGADGSGKGNATKA